MRKLGKLLATGLVLSSLYTTPVLAETGIVSWYDQQSGIGVITDTTTNQSYFLHFSYIVNSNCASPPCLVTGDTVTFVPSVSEEGVNIATQVEVIR